MAKFYGKIGFIETVDNGNGIWEERETVRKYYADVGNDVRRWDYKQNASNDDLQLNNNMSILCDSFLQEHAGAIKWVEWGGARWRVSSVEINYPRLTLHFGGVWDGTPDEG